MANSEQRVATVQLPPKMIPVFNPPRGSVRYRGAHGGRGSAKSFNFAKMAAIMGAIEPLRILCTREFQASIKESFHAELKNAIASEPWLEASYDVGVDYIKGKYNKTIFIFRGLRRSMSSIKSLAKIDICIVEEAEDVPEQAWIDLEPTIRAPKSEIWPIWNPRLDGSPVDLRFIKDNPERSVIVEVNFRDNPWFPEVLEELRKRDQRILDDATYAHIWEGKYLQNSEAQIFRNKFTVQEFIADESFDGPYYGLDFGFSQDPTAGVKCWVKKETLYIEYEAGKVGLELDDTGDYMIERVPGIEQHTVRADSARPESISYLRRHGLPRIVPVDKGPGSVEDGIEHIKSYIKVIIHPRCKETINEFRLYSFKVDKNSGDVLTDIVDAYNHYIDAVRYALRPLMSKGKLKINKSALQRSRS